MFAFCSLTLMRKTILRDIPMKLRDTYFDNVVVSSGGLNFLLDGWPFHQLNRMVPGFNYEKATLVTKTTTIDLQYGNMPLKQNLQPAERRPTCIKMYFWKGIALNAVGLSGPGAPNLFSRDIWQQIKKPFFISFAVIGDTLQQYKEEMEKFVDLLSEQLTHFSTDIGLEIDVSCPTVYYSPKHLAKKAVLQLEIASKLNIPLVIKLNPLIDIRSVEEMAKSDLCDAISISNAIPHGALPDRINWKKLFGTDVSPLAKYGYGDGGLSGWPLVPIVADKIKEVRDFGITIPIIAGGGIGCRRFGLFYKKEIMSYKEAGANAIAIGIAMAIRPWMMRRMIDFGNRVFI